MLSVLPFYLPKTPNSFRAATPTGRMLHFLCLATLCGRHSRACCGSAAHQLRTPAGLLTRMRRTRECVSYSMYATRRRLPPQKTEDRFVSSAAWHDARGCWDPADICTSTRTLLNKYPPTSKFQRLKLMIIPTSPTRMMKSASAPAAPKTPLRHSPPPLPTPLYIHKQPTNPPEKTRNQKPHCPLTVVQSKPGATSTSPAPPLFTSRNAKRAGRELKLFVFKAFIMWF